MKQYRRFLRIAATFLLCMAPGTAAAQPAPDSRPPRPRSAAVNYGGRKVPRRSSAFAATGVKIEEEGDGQLTISVFFNDVVDSHSVTREHILLNGHALPPETEFLFSKKRNMVRFRVRQPRPENGQGDMFSLRFSCILAYDGRAAKEAELRELRSGSFFIYSAKEQAWRKSSL